MVNSEDIKNLLIEYADLAEYNSDYYKKHWAKVYTVKKLTKEDFEELYNYLKIHLANNHNFVFRIKLFIPRLEKFNSRTSVSNLNNSFSNICNIEYVVKFYMKPIEHIEYSEEESNIIKWLISNKFNKEGLTMEIKNFKCNSKTYYKYKDAVKRLNENLFYNYKFEIVGHKKFISSYYNVWIYSKKLE